MPGHQVTRPRKRVYFGTISSPPAQDARRAPLLEERPLSISRLFHAGPESSSGVACGAFLPSHRGVRSILIRPVLSLMRPVFGSLSITLAAPRIPVALSCFRAR